MSTQDSAVSAKCVSDVCQKKKKTKTK